MGKALAGDSIRNTDWKVGSMDESVGANLQMMALGSSLPEAMGLEEKTKLRNSVSASPTFEMLVQNKVSQAKLLEEGAEGQKLRRKCMRGAIVIFFTAGYYGKKFIFERAKELGVRCWVVDGPGSWVKDMEGDVVEKFIPVDFSDNTTLFERSLKAIKDTMSKHGDPDGICTFCEMAVPITTRLAEALGLPANSPQAVDLARDKNATRQVMKDKGLPTPSFCLIEGEQDLDKAISTVGFPAVIKPIGGAASMGVVRVDNEEDMRREYQKVVSYLKKAVIRCGALVEGDDTTEDDGATGKFEVSLMMEQYLDGPEVDVDIVLSEGKPVYCIIQDNYPTIEPYFQEVGACCPSILPQNQQDELKQLAVDATLCLGFHMGVFHVELKYTSHGARLIEVNCRMGGAQVRNINLFTWGVDLVEEQLLTTIGIPSRPNKSKTPLKYIAEMQPNCPRSGVLENNDILEEVAKMPCVLVAKPAFKPGSKVTGPQEAMPSWLGEVVVFSDKSVEDANAIMKDIHDNKLVPGWAIKEA